MADIKAGLLWRDTKNKLTKTYEDQEAEAVAMLLVEHFTGVSRMDIMTNTVKQVREEALAGLQDGILKCLANVPVQHITGEGHFYGRVFRVSADVLIPRPETEELVHMILQDYKDKSIELTDLGTGSGCIAITLALEHTGARVSACDVSPYALSVAKENAKSLGANVSFFQADMLRESLQKNELDVIVSNPPYIPASEKNIMPLRVTSHEPGLALFVPDDDPLIFYRRIGELGNTHLKPDGRIYVEIHENLGVETKTLYETQGYEDVRLVKDLQGKDRIVRATRKG